MGKMMEILRTTAANAISTPATRDHNYTRSPLLQAFKPKIKRCNRRPNRGMTDLPAAMAMGVDGLGRGDHTPATQHPSQCTTRLKSALRESPAIAEATTKRRS